jgi:hypothetical protein
MPRQWKQRKLLIESQNKMFFNFKRHRPFKNTPPHLKYKKQNMTHRLEELLKTRSSLTGIVKKSQTLIVLSTSIIRLT